MFHAMLSTEEVRHIALLARIGLSDTEVESFRKDLSGVLDFFHELGELPISETGESSVVPIKENDTRPDRVEGFGSDGKKRIMEGVPVKQGGYVKVRSVF